MWPFSKKVRPAAGIAKIQEPSLPVAAFDRQEIPDGPYRARYVAILNALMDLRRSRAARVVFGANDHGFHVKPPLTEAELEAFETRHNVRLPDEYRGFLLHVGNGGAGPGYGLFRLGEVDDMHDDRAWQEGDGFIGVLKAPFPHSAAWNDMSGAPEIGNTSGLSQTEEDAIYDAYDKWQIEHYYAAHFMNGAIPLCHMGCAIRRFLVISGPEAGNVWTDDRGNENGIFPVTMGDAERVTFLEWYEEWLEGAAAQAL